MPLRIRGRVFATLTAARTAIATVDADIELEPAITNPDGSTARAAIVGRPVFVQHHSEGLGLVDYRITNPGLAADRIRTRGVTTARVLRILRRAGGGAFLVPEPRSRVLAGASDITSGYDDATETS